MGRFDDQAARSPRGRAAPSGIRRFAAAPLLAACVALGACTTSSVSTGYYDITGQSAEELDREISLKGPSGGKAIASAAISFTPVALEPRIRGGQCSFRKAKIRVNADITLPRWREAAYSDDDRLRRNWEGFADYARVHEQAHVRIAEAFAKDLERAYRAIPPQSSCERLSQIAAGLYGEMFPVYRAAQKAFDASERERIGRLIAEAEAREQGS